MNIRNAILTQKAISHSREAEEVLNAWEASRYRSPISILEGNFIDQFENNHYFATFRGRINARDINGLPLVLVFTEAEHTQSPMADLWEYVRSFDARTGKRKQENTEDSQSATNTQRRIDDNRASYEESEL
ncbi:hypothetical protein BDQ94DRAFT_176198 [Aspergillus welwitschiae]|uniref:Uncharacterized protein n=1 Tax=Aspergillus welwitschiae TaxID=1341132 RepID=A0A3F3PJ02_9EURO|nr:hypothetical protein BDQ94DRAFT_176198 [Aspergillus welwitschiae]RDH26722.1 hypothetical protein BDQ94DRAFT_176198 [Aspergillus welwitschiae]